jgi:hypothetical protein
MRSLHAAVDPIILRFSKACHMRPNGARALTYSKTIEGWHATRRMQSSGERPP